MHSDKPPETGSTAFFKVRLWVTSLEPALARLATHLMTLGYEVDTTRIDYLVFKFRKEEKQWTQGWVRNHERFVTFSGPETEVLKAFATTLVEIL